MAQPLVPCPSCARHVLATETQCPFCASALPDDLEDQVIPGAPRRLSRAAAFMLGASLAVTGCEGTVVTEEASGASSGGGGAGGQGSASSGGQGGGPVDDGGGQPLYGVPPPMDAGADAPDDDGGVMAMYGIPPPQDAGAPQDDGGVQPLYGAAPPRPNT
jgi:hypothetical protein